MNKNGVTLIELMIYIILFSIVAVLIGSQMKTMVTGYSGGKQISRLQSDSRDFIAVISRELRNTGFKRYLLSQGNGELQDVIIGNASLFRFFIFYT